MIAPPLIGSNPADLELLEDARTWAAGLAAALDRLTAAGLEVEILAERLDVDCIWIVGVAASRPVRP